MSSFLVNIGKHQFLKIPHLGKTKIINIDKISSIEIAEHHKRGGIIETIVEIDYSTGNTTNKLIDMTHGDAIYTHRNQHEFAKGIYKLLYPENTK